MANFISRVVKVALPLGLIMSATGWPFFDWNIHKSFTIGTTTTKGSDLTFTLPVTAVTHSTPAQSAGIGYWTPAGVGSWGVAYVLTTTTGRLLAYTTGGTYLDTATFAAAVPALWATTNTINFSLTYEAA